MGFFMHAQTVDTRPLFPPPTWPGYEANFSTAQFSVLASIIFMFTPDWKKKDEEHAEWDRRRRNSQEQVGEL